MTSALLRPREAWCVEHLDAEYPAFVPQTIAMNSPAETRHPGSEGRSTRGCLVQSSTSSRSEVEC